MRLQSFRMPEIADATIWMFGAECIAFPTAWLWATRGDARAPLSLGLLLFGAGAYLSTFLTPDWQSADFRLTLVLIGLGQGLFLVPTLYYATRDVLPAEGTTAASLFNLSRIAGQTFGVAVIGSLITDREKWHSAEITQSFTFANQAFQDRFNGLVASFLAQHGDGGLAESQAWKSLSGLASTQAYVLAFADAFIIVAMVMAASAFLAPMLPRLIAKPDAAPAGTAKITGAKP